MKVEVVIYEIIKIVNHFVNEIMGEVVNVTYIGKIKDEMNIDHVVNYENENVVVEIIANVFVIFLILVVTVVVTIIMNKENYINDHDYLENVVVNYMEVVITVLIEIGY